MPRKHAYVNLDDKGQRDVSNIMELESTMSSGMEKKTISIPTTPTRATSSLLLSQEGDKDKSESQTSVSTSTYTLSTVTEKVYQTHVGSFLKRIILTARKAIYTGLMLLFSLDYQQFSLVENTGFRRFV